jgi:uncharacterized RDD family membrane protein YckC
MSYESAPPPPFADGGDAWTGGTQYAGWWSRAGGYVIDGLVLAVVTAAVSFGAHVYHIDYTTVRGVRTPHLHASPEGLVIDGVAALLYGTLLLGSARGQTLGMMVCRIRVANLDGSPQIGYGRALGRAAIVYVLGLLVFFALPLVILLVVDLLFPVFDKRNQTVHDKIVSSVVVRAAPG